MILLSQMLCARNLEFCFEASYTDVLRPRKSTRGKDETHCNFQLISKGKSMLYDSCLARKYYSSTERGEKEEVKKESERFGKWWGQKYTDFSILYTYFAKNLGKTR